MSAKCALVLGGGIAGLWSAVGAPGSHADGGLTGEASGGDVAEAALVEANSKFRAVWLGAVPNMQSRELIERHDEHVRWVRQMTLEDTKVRKKAIAGLRKVLEALQGGKPAAASAAVSAPVSISS